MNKVMLINTTDKKIDNQILNLSGFTIVELLVVIVVIGILAAITIVSYTGITSRAVVSALQSDLTNASSQLKLYQIDHSAYPTSLNASNCPLDSSGVVDSTYCIKPTSGNTFLYSSNNNSTPQTFSLYAINTSTDTKYRTTNNSTPALSPQVVATGGTITNVGGYRIHTFTTSSTFTVTSGGDVEYLVVGGGGGGGSNSSYGATGAGGGGGGGFLTGYYLSTSIQPYPVVVGTGGAGMVGHGNGTPGGNSSVFSLTAIGGGFGAGDSTNGGGGGSGGGSSNAPVGSGGIGTLGQGNSGGDGLNGNGGGGGGGASTAGNPGANDIGGIGGSGFPNSFRTGLAENYSGGGGGGGGRSAGGIGGSGVGGQGGGTATSTNSTNGTANTGGGGGGGSYGAAAYGGNGGSGIVIIRYPN